MNVSKWLNEIDSAKKREKDYRKDGQEILDIYEGEKPTPFNILYSNTETLLPALFSQVPRPVIKPRFKGDDQMGSAVSEAGQRMLEYLVDTDVDGYESFDGAIADATLDGLLPGRGVTSIEYESDEAVRWESVCANSRSWDRVYFGYARKWSKVPWVAYEEYLDKGEATELFGGEVAGKLIYTEGEEPGEEESSHKSDPEEKQGSRESATIYQVWDKENREILYISPQNKDDVLLRVEDPLGLSGFFNCPKPIQFVKKSNTLVPTPLFALYENQAKELNRIQLRLNRVIEAIKVRGAYNSSLGIEMENLLKEDDNALVPTDNATMLADGGFDKNIWMLPIEKLMAVARELMQARESAKRVIYEITGISDIVRGQSLASETLGAQKIKESWGTMRLKRLQKEVQRYALDVMKLMLEVAANKFSEASWAKMTGLPYLTEADFEKAQAQMAALSQMQRQAQMQAQATGQQPAPQQVQQWQQQMAQVQGTLKQPRWSDVLKLMQDEFLRSYRVDIETNSTLDVEATEDKALVGDFMNAMAQYMNGIGPLIENGTMPFGAAKSMMLAIVKRYRFGREVEEELKAMQPPKPQVSPEMEKGKKQFEQERAKFEAEKKRIGEQLDQEAVKLQVQKQQMQYEQKLSELELRHKEQLASMKADMTQVEMESQLESVFVKYKAQIQSMLDKSEARMQNAQQKVA